MMVTKPKPRNAQPVNFAVHLRFPLTRKKQIEEAMQRGGHLSLASYVRSCVYADLARPKR